VKAPCIIIVKFIEHTMSNLSVEPQTVVKLLRCGLQRNSGHQLTFNNVTAQHDYFESRVLYTYTDFTYVRDNNSITVGDNLDAIRDCNYLMYQNTGFANKWFYAFITDLEYVNENCTRVYFDTDSWQTWMHDFDLHTVFVEREHTNDDTVGANIVPETIATGEYKCYSENYIDDLDELVYVVQATAKAPMDTGSTWNGATPYGKVSMVGGAYITNDYSFVDLLAQSYLSSTDQNVKNAIYNVYVIPKAIISNTLPDNATAYERYAGQTSEWGVTKVFSKPTKLGNYTVKNNKLLTYPYRYLLVSNNNGMSNILKYEYWEQSNDCQFELKGVPVVGGSIKLSPASYSGGKEENGIMAGKYPVCNWTNDNYTNWLTQNGVNQKLDVISTIGSMLGSGGYGLDTTLGDTQATGMGMGNAIGNVISGAARIGKIVQNDRVHQMQAPSAAGNTNGGDVNISSNKNGFFLYHMGVTEEMARVIDDYFSMYGYQTNKRKFPNLGMTINGVHYQGRASWNYVKTVGCDFDAKNSSKMSREDEIKIQQMFDNGVTLWHDPATMYDYGQLNFIV
jgi:hypothetical protein